MARLLFCGTILLTFPLECFVARDVIENVFFAGKQPPSNTRHFGVTLLIVLLCYVISISTDCLGVVLELNVKKTLSYKKKYITIYVFILIFIMKCVTGDTRCDAIGVYFTSSMFHSLGSISIFEQAQDSSDCNRFNDIIQYQLQ